MCKALGQKLWGELGNSSYLKGVSVEEGKSNVYAIHPSKVILSLSVISCLGCLGNLAVELSYPFIHSVSESSFDSFVYLFNKT